MRPSSSYRAHRGGTGRGYDGGRPGLAAHQGAAPVVGATKPHHIDGAVAACDLVLTPQEITAIEDPYVPHAVVGVVAENRPPVSI